MSAQKAFRQVVMMLSKLTDAKLERSKLPYHTNPNNDLSTRRRQWLVDEYTAKSPSDWIIARLYSSNPDGTKLGDADSKVPYIWVRFDKSTGQSHAKEVHDELKKLGTMTQSKASSIGFFYEIRLDDKKLAEAVDERQKMVRKVMTTLTPFVTGKFVEVKWSALENGMYAGFKAVPHGTYDSSAEPEAAIYFYKQNPSPTLDDKKVKGWYDHNYVVIHANVLSKDVAKMEAELRKVSHLDAMITKPTKPKPSVSPLGQVSANSSYVWAKLKLPLVQEVNSLMRHSFKSFVSEAKRKPSLDIGVVDVGSAIEEHRALSKKLAILGALGKKLGHRVAELEALMLPIVKETEAQQLSINNAIVKFGSRHTTGISYKSAFEKALDLVNEEQKAALKAFLETVTNRDTKEYVDWVDTEVSELLDKVKAAEKTDDVDELESILHQIMGLSNRIKEGRFTDTVVKAFGWTKLSKAFEAVRDKFKSLRKKIDWLEHVANHPEKFGG